MATAKHKMTTGHDKITGGAGSDLFLGLLKNGHATLNAHDTLNGGAGIDTIRAALVDVSGLDPLAPVMKSIERGIFLTTSVSNTSLDLAHAARLTSLTFQENGKHQGSEVFVRHTSHVGSVTVRNTDSASYELDNADPAKLRDIDVAFDHTLDSSISFIGDTHAVFRSVHVDITSSYGATLSGNAVAAKTLVLNSLGDSENYFIDNPVMNTAFTQNLVITGTQDLTVSNNGAPLAHLHTYDASGMSATVWSTIGGKQLHDVVGGKGTDILDITSIGGTKAAPAVVNLGGNWDILTLHYSFDAATQRYNGGGGFDTIALTGAADDLNKAAKSFDEVDVSGAMGVYEVGGMHLTTFEVKSAAAAMTVDQLADKGTLAIYGDISTFLTVNVAHAGSSTSDSMRVLLQDAVQLGTQSAGLLAPDLSHLQIDCYTDDHVMYLGTVGSASDAAAVTITGAKHLELHAANFSTSYISSLTISNEGAGADISGLADGTQAFVASGATIVGGDGDDILVGGAGADQISAGGGSNTVIGSLGADIVTLTANSGLDMLVFTDKAQSAYGVDHDTIANLGILDGIDLSGLGVKITFAGNVANASAGMAELSNAHATAFFSEADHILYIDLNHDQQFSAAADMEIKLSGVADLNSAQLLL